MRPTHPQNDCRGWLRPWRLQSSLLSLPHTYLSPAVATVETMGAGFAWDDRGMRRRWYDSDRIAQLERWRYLLGSIVLVGFGPSVLESVTSDASAWNWFTAALWVVAVIWYAYSAVTTWRTRHTPPKVHLSPTDVPTQDVQRIVQSVPDRVRAVKELRESHSGLTLTDAVDLIDAARGTTRPGAGPSVGD